MGGKNQEEEEEEGDVYNKGEEYDKCGNVCEYGHDDNNSEDDNNKDMLILQLQVLQLTLSIK